MTELNLYAWSTPNGYKPLILLHELELEFNLHAVALDGAQKSPDFLRINPNGKIPALKAGELTIFESGAILVYLAERYQRLLPQDPGPKSQVLEWVFFQNAGIGPMLGQYGFFKRSEEQVPMALLHYGNEVGRLLKVLETQLLTQPYLAGADYTIADITTHPWLRKLDFFGIEPGDFPALEEWIERVGQSPAVQKAYATPFPKPD